MNWNQEQYQQLTEHYRDMSDAELLHLAKTPDDLTDLANEVLTKEMSARKLARAESTQQASPSFEESDEDEEIDNIVWFDYAQKAPAHCTFDCASVRQAQDAAAFLWESKIESYVLNPNPGGMSLLGPAVVVRPEDAERAKQILAQPIPEHIADEPEIVVEDFISPTCPNCNAPDPILIAFEPTNRWLCETCEHEWDDPEPA